MTSKDNPPPRRSVISDATRHRVIARFVRCIRALLIQLGRDYERCGKAACARSRRCRGLACEPHAPHGLSR